MTQLDKVQLAVRNCITDISSGSSRLSFFAASVAAGALSFFPMGSFGYAVAFSVNELFVNSRAEERAPQFAPSMDGHFAAWEQPELFSAGNTGGVSIIALIGIEREYLGWPRITVTAVVQLAIGQVSSRNTEQ